jgi:hypothetical protein
MSQDGQSKYLFFEAPPYTHWPMPTVPKSCCQKSWTQYIQRRWKSLYQRIIVQLTNLLQILGRLCFPQMCPALSVWSDLSFLLKGCRFSNFHIWLGTSLHYSFPMFTALFSETPCSAEPHIWPTACMVVVDLLYFVLNFLHLFLHSKTLPSYTCKALEACSDL